MNISERINALRCKMKEHHIDAYIIPSADNHQSEYVGDYFKCREYITGFTGSAGTAVITKDKAGLWTDGRYFIQAEQELSGSNITLYKLGNPNVPTILEFLEKELPQNGSLGFDGKLISMKEGIHFQTKFAHKKICIVDGYDLVGKIWKNRPTLPNAQLFLLGKEYSGESTASKLQKVRMEMEQAGATTHLLATLDDIAWLFNIRGKDVAYVPVGLCYAIIEKEDAHLFINEKKLTNEVSSYLSKEQVIIHPYDEIFQYVSALSSHKVVLLDPNRISYALYKKLPTEIKHIEKTNPCILLKARKNKTEIKNIKAAHLKDAIAHTKFMYWLKTSIGKECITEISASKKLESLRAEQKHFLWPSFEPISAYGTNGAICHYSSSEETNVELKEGTFYLTDTGGHYLEGSTDITRTIALGEVSKEMKQHFTNVLRGNLALSRAVFPYGCSGKNLDILARQFLWKNHLDYNHGTGHGVGYLLSIHESGCRFHWRSSEETSRPLEEGMVITNEPGFYLEGSYGIRIENELLVQKSTCNEYGHFMNFEVLTYVPIDLDAIDTTLLDESEKMQLNEYHHQVYELIKPYLTNEEKEWLAHYTHTI